MIQGEIGIYKGSRGLSATAFYFFIRNPEILLTKQKTAKKP